MKQECKNSEWWHKISRAIIIGKSIIIHNYQDKNTLINDRVYVHLDSDLKVSHISRGGGEASVGH